MKLKVIQIKADGSVVGESLHVDGKERLYVTVTQDNDGISCSTVADLMEHAFIAGAMRCPPTKPFDVEYTEEEYDVG